MAAAPLTSHERTGRLGRQRCLGGLYVSDPHRGRGLAATRIEDLMARAAALEVRSMSVRTATDDGRLYRRLGGSPLEKPVPHDGGLPVRVMLRRLAPP